MRVTAILGDVAHAVDTTSDDGLWLRAADVLRFTGWDVSPDGACQGARCVPLPVDATRGDEVELAALARQLGQPVIHDSRHRVWLIGDEADVVRDALLDGTAPDFTLADLDGRSHTLSQYRGRKVFLVTWASW